MWVATGNNSPEGSDFGNIMHSYDGIVWNSSDETGDKFDNHGNEVAFGTKPNGTSPMWVAVGGTGSAAQILYSYNGIKWFSAGGEIFDEEGYGVAFGLSFRRSYSEMGCCWNRYNIRSKNFNI